MAFLQLQVRELLKVYGRLKVYEQQQSQPQAMTAILLPLAGEGIGFTAAASLPAAESLRAPESP
ncbi:hypothetical protein [Stenotrophomonas sp. PS02298]|uniref:hypothetical protein n=1 Tax=Stenotrophomonas sp. PS02298 TaxID=2991424 RepID=UPI00249BC2EF|nr:hypothetical protein [Stenotrophomonas sp. PS02298]